jgi:PEP-CTERM motif
MNMNILQKLFPTLVIVPLAAIAQGTFVFDQQSSDESNSGSGLNFIQNVQPTGQSFTPSFNGIGFVRLNIFDWNSNNGTGAVISVNLRSDSITGPIIDSTAPVSLPDNFGRPLGSGSQYITFYFGNTVALQPGVTYFLQPVVQSGDLVAIFADTFGYTGGAQYVLGNPSPTTDYWFREGIVVPEPSTSALLLLAAGLWVQSRRSRRHAAQLTYARSSHNSERKQGGS